ncbi:MAG: class I SAM-dependent methyltransferase [Hyphomicrobiaceae bacterium]|nr:class I SAM-dependent methyltransferase [Hyphomicrobiaceae bacterium]
MLNWWEGLKAARKERRRLAKFQKAQAWSAGLGLQETFERIYAEGKWGRSEDGAPFCSGNGSKPEHSQAYEAYVADFLTAHPDVGRMVDIGCGDFQVSGRVLARLQRPIAYTGCDIVRPMIEQHQRQHGRPDRTFLVLDAVADDPPAGDLVVIRQILQHLSNAHVLAILERARRLYTWGIITESLPVPKTAANLDIAPGIATRIALGSGVYVDEPPFNLGVIEAFEVPHGPNEVMRTSLVRF